VEPVVYFDTDHHLLHINTIAPKLKLVVQSFQI